MNVARLARLCPRPDARRDVPHRAPTGLVRIGRPGRRSPVLLTGNFTLTVRRLRDALRGRDAWLLVANSKGVNVWCAAGGGHLHLSRHHRRDPYVGRRKLGRPPGGHPAAALRDRRRAPPRNRSDRVLTRAGARRGWKVCRPSSTAGRGQPVHDVRAARRPAPGQGHRPPHRRRLRPRSERPGRRPLRARPKRSSSSRIISTPAPPHRSTKPFPRPRPGVWSNASNGITRPNMAPGWTWPNRTRCSRLAMSRPAHPQQADNHRPKSPPGS